MADNKMSLPGSFGGIMRYDEEYESKFMLSPNHVIAYIILVVVVVIGLRLFWTVAA